MQNSQLRPAPPDLAVPAPRTVRRVPPRPPWTCANCATPNLGRRKRCTDCGTLRF